MAIRLFRPGLVAAALATFSAPAYAEYCATQPPPDGLVPRCHHLDMVVPGSRAALDMALESWMNSCAIDGRGGELVFGNDSVDDVWELIKDRRDTANNSVRILPDYEPNEYTSEGRTCYGIESVTFDVAGARGEVDADGDIVVTPADSIDAFTDDQVRSAAAAGLRALQTYPGSNAYERSRMQNVLTRMQSYGSDFNDLYYRLAPETDLTGDLNPPACFKDGGFPPRCAAADAARKECARHLGPTLVNAHLSGAGDRELADRLLDVANDLGRAKQYLIGMQGQDSEGAIACPSIKTVFMPEIGALARDPRTIYNAWDAGP